MNTREEAISKGIPLAPKKNQKNRRAPWHNYRLPGLYMITMATAGRQRLLGHLLVSPTPRIDLSVLGQKILVEETPKMHAMHPNVKLWKVCMMPDHIHMIIEVTEEFPGKKHLGNVISGFKSGCNKAYRLAFGLEGGTMFEKGYNDRIIMPGMDYERWKVYLDDNPRRLAVKHLHPEFFTTLYDMSVCGCGCHVFGNLFLLDNPDKMEVIVHRADTDADYARNFERWIECGARGGVLVSAAVAPREKDVINEAKSCGYRVIELCDNGFSPYYKPAGKSFDACAAGLLLQISPWGYSASNSAITRGKCLQLNELATKIAHGPCAKGAGCSN